MKTYLLPPQAKRFKANLHNHTTRSDGSFTPEQIKEEYIKEGYSVVAYTDHNEYHDSTALCSKDFIAINSFEADISDWAVQSGNYRRCYHFNAFHCGQDSSVELPQVPEYNDIDGINAYIARLNELGFIEAYNHPNWSLQSYNDYYKLKGLFAVEIYNHSATVDGSDNGEENVYNSLLGLGNRLACIMTDDNHDRYPVGHPQNDSFGGFTVLFAEELTYDAVFNALKTKNFYCSQGPKINALYIENNKLHVECSDAQLIKFCTKGRRNGTAFAPKGGFINAAEFELDPSDVFVRAEVVGPTGRKANTNAYFLDDLGLFI